MQESYHKKATLKNRSLSLILAIALVLSVFAVAFTATTLADSVARTYYFDTSKNHDWNPTGADESLVATFTDAGGNPVGSATTLTAVSGKSNLYRVTAPAGASKIRLYIVSSSKPMPSVQPAANTKRVFFNNKPNWHTPSVYAFNGDDDNNGWHSSAGNMTRINSTSYYYFDVPSRYGWIIFNDGVTANSYNGNGQTGDISMTDAKADPVFSMSSGTSWDTAPYYRSHAEVSLDSRPTGADEMYAMDDGTVKFSKYAYKSTDPRNFSSGDEIYLYAPSWAQAYVTWDYDDPYVTAPVQMTAATYNGVGGYYKATVPRGAKIQFSYSYATSNQTTYTTGSQYNCYNMKNSANIWCKPGDAVSGEVTTFTAPIEASGHNTAQAYWADAVYYDYLSDTELEASGGWLNPKKAGTGHNNSEDDWYEHYNFNNKVSAALGTTVNFPLYFGNFCNTPRSYLNNATHGGPYSNAFNGLNNFYYYVNNSNGMPNYHYAIQGLAGGLNSDGSILFPEGVQMPYFDSVWLRDTKVNNRSVGTTVKSAFPFRQEDMGDGVTLYSFDSYNATDNVFFNWNGNTPQTVGYGQGSGSYGVEDGIRYFMYPQDTDPDTGAQYQSKKYYGIFPFNGKNSNGGNNNLDYGFGIKTEMDFRVPAGGTLPNGKLVNGTNDVTFSFSGDDDLWVYICEVKPDGTPDYENAELVLDLGGNHKMAEGVINFRTMTASTTKNHNSIETKAATARSDIRFKHNCTYIVDSYGWNAMWVHAWGGSGDKDFQLNAVPGYTVEGHKVYELPITDLGNSLTFCVHRARDSWGVGSNESQNLSITQAHYGNLTYANTTDNYVDNILETASGSGTPKDTSKTSLEQNLTYQGATQNVKSFNGGTQLDPNKTYHISVFYMERGMLESNCRIQFTMTPANNDLQVNKTVNAEDVNPGLRSAVQNRPFNFTTTENGAVNKTAAYTHYAGSTITEKKVNTSTGVYTLSHGQTADFDNQYATGSTLSVGETLPTKGVQYEAIDWTVVNNATGELIAQYNPSSSSSNPVRTNNFVFKNDNNSYVTRQVSFVNIPQVQGDITLEKDVVDENGAPVNDIVDEFEFRILVSLDGDSYAVNPGSFSPYRLRYTAHTEDGDVNLYTDADGKFRFLSSDTVTFSGIPVGATYVLIESPKAGYMPYRINGAGFDGTYSSVLGEQDQELDIINQQKPITTSMKIRKYVAKADGAQLVNNYYYVNGSLFSFTAEGLGQVEFNSAGEMTVDASQMRKTVSATDAMGEATFSNSGVTDNFLKFTQPGTYAFKIYESDKVNGNTADNYSQAAYGTADFRTYKNDFDTCDSVFLALFTVAPDPADVTQLVVNGPVYYKYDGTSTINRSAFADNKILGVGDLTHSGDPLMPEFVNSVQTGSVKVVKSSDSAGNHKLDQVEFALYKVTGDGDEASVKNENLVQALETNTNGIAEFKYLNLYQFNSEGDYEGNPAYQWYALQETRTKDGHVHNKTIAYFTLPMVDAQSGVLKYDVTFDYVNGVIKHPETAGQGVKMLLYCGIGIIALSGLMLLAYVLYFKKKKAYVPAHLRK